MNRISKTYFFVKTILVVWRKYDFIEPFARKSPSAITLKCDFQWVGKCFILSYTMKNRQAELKASQPACVYRKSVESSKGAPKK